MGSLGPSIESKGVGSKVLWRREMEMHWGGGGYSEFNLCLL